MNKSNTVYPDYQWKMQKFRFSNNKIWSYIFLSNFSGFFFNFLVSCICIRAAESETFGKAVQNHSLNSITYHKLLPELFFFLNWYFFGYNFSAHGLKRTERECSLGKVSCRSWGEWTGLFWYLFVLPQPVFSWTRLWN